MGKRKAPKGVFLFAFLLRAAGKEKVVGQMNLLHLFHAGGFMMYPLIICSVIVIAIAIERFRFYQANRSDLKTLTEKIPSLLRAHDMEGLRELLKKDGGIPAQVILSAAEQLGTSARQEVLVEGAASHAAAQLRNYLNYLDVIVTMSPLMGLLGTVVGMINSFNVLSISNGQPFAITGGVAEALVCTATGLMVAIMSLIVYTYFTHCLDNYISQIEKTSALYLAVIEGGQS